jgi:hypothetical protein
VKTNKIAVAAITAVGLVAPFGLSVGAAHADSNMGYVIGTVTDSAGHPVYGATVKVASTSGDYDTASTDRLGHYVVGVYDWEVADGGTWTILANNAGGLTDSTAQAVTAPAVGQNVAGPTIALAPAAYTPPSDLTGVVLTGSVSTPNGPAHTGWVDAIDPATGRVIYETSIEPNGAYYFYGSSTPGDYDINSKSVKLEFNVDGYQSLFYGGTTSRRLAPTLAVPAYGQAPAVVNGAVTAAGTITGSVKLPAAGANWSADVTIFDLDGNEVGYSQTDATGHFSADVPAGTYYVRADGRTWANWVPTGSTTAQKLWETQYDFVAGYYGGKKAVSLATAKKLVVGANAIKSVGTITLTNAYHAIEKPFVTAKKGIKKGARLKVGHGAWNHSANTNFTYTWKVGKKTIGHKASLKLTKKIWKKKLKNGKKVKKLTVTVTANDKYGFLVSGSSKQKVAKALAKEQKAAQKAVKKAQKQAKKVQKKTKH